MQISQPHSSDPFKVSTHTPTSRPDAVPVEKGYSAKIEDSGTGAPEKGFIHASTEKKIVRGVAAVLTLGISEGLRKIVSKALSHEVLTPKELHEKRQEFVNSNESNSPKRFEVATKHTNLDGMLIAPKGKPPLSPDNPHENKDKHFVISLHGLLGRYEGLLNESKELADKSGAHVLVFNYRGRGESKGDASSKGDDWVNDTIAMVAYLKSKGVPEENITIVGHSMGGAIGTNAADRFDRVKLVNHNSFGSLSKTTKSVAQNLTDNKIGRVFMSGIGRAAGAVVRSSYNLNAGKTLNRNQELRESALFFTAQNDQVISQKVSITEAVTPKFKPLEGKKIDHIEMHPDPIKNRERMDDTWVKLIDVRANYNEKGGLHDQLLSFIKSVPNLELDGNDFRDNAKAVLNNKAGEFLATRAILREIQEVTKTPEEKVKIESLIQGINGVLREINPNQLLHFTTHDAHEETLLTSLDRMKGGEEQIEKFLNFVNPSRIAATFDSMDFSDVSGQNISKNFAPAAGNFDLFFNRA